VNATLFPISSQGNTITIRKFRRDPWTVTDFINNGTVNSGIMALVWIAMQYELNIVISGGTASGKTSLLNVCMPFIQPNHRIITMEETRELALPPYLHWIPLTTREPNIEGKGEVTLYDLLVNSLRMRPDRMVLGEVRRAKEVEVLFEGMHTGHSAYTTVHANTALETILRLVNPPINVPLMMLEAVHLNLVMYRNRRTGQRRLLEVAEFIPEKREIEQRIRPNVLFRWNPAEDTIVQREKPTRVWDELLLVTGAKERELNDELAEKETILKWMAKKNITGMQRVGKVMAEYYLNPERILLLAEKNKEFE
jgi:flagellar protein FlaI